MRASDRLFQALAAAAAVAAPCPSNRDLRAATGAKRDRDVTILFADLRRRRRIAVDRFAPANGIRRVLMLDTGLRTGWSGPIPDWCADALLAGDGHVDPGALFGRGRGCFANVTPAEARRLAAGSPPDRGLPRAPERHSAAGCALSVFARDDDGNNEDEFDGSWR